jgi:hypothetical protein
VFLADAGETEDSCEDIEQLVIFEDITPMLFKFDEDNHFDVVIHFLSILGMPSARHLLRKPTSSYHQQLYYSSLISSSLQMDSACIPSRMLRGSWRDASLTDDTVTINRQISTELSRNILEICLNYFKGEKKSQLASLLIETYLSGFLHSKGSCDARELKQLKKAVRRNSKAILSDADFRSSASSLHVWTSFALLEWELGNHDDSRKGDLRDLADDERIANYVVIRVLSRPATCFNLKSKPYGRLLLTDLPASWGLATRRAILDFYFFNLFKLVSEIVHLIMDRKSSIRPCPCLRRRL